MTLETIAAWLSLLAVVAPDLDRAAVLGTTLVLHVCYAILCRIFAANASHPRTLWTVLGFIGGVWAVAGLLLLPPHGRPVPPHEDRLR